MIFRNPFCKFLVASFVLNLVTTCSASTAIPGSSTESTPLCPNDKYILEPTEAMRLAERVSFKSVSDPTTRPYAFNGGTIYDHLIHPGRTVKNICPQNPGREAYILDYGSGCGGEIQRIIAWLIKDGFKPAHKIDFFNFNGGFLDPKEFEGYIPGEKHEVNISSVTIDDGETFDLFTIENYWCRVNIISRCNLQNFCKVVKPFGFGQNTDESKFDFIMCKKTLFHLARPLETFEQMFNCLSVNGIASTDFFAFAHFPKEGPKEGIFAPVPFEALVPYEQYRNDYTHAVSCGLPGNFPVYGEMEYYGKKGIIPTNKLYEEILPTLIQNMLSLLIEFYHQTGASIICATQPPTDNDAYPFGDILLYKTTDKTLHIPLEPITTCLRPTPVGYSTTEYITAYSGELPKCDATFDEKQWFMLCSNDKIVEQLKKQSILLAPGEKLSDMQISTDPKTAHRPQITDIRTQIKLLILNEGQKTVTSDKRFYIRTMSPNLKKNIAAFEAEEKGIYDSLPKMRIESGTTLIKEKLIAYLSALPKDELLKTIQQLQKELSPRMLLEIMKSLHPRK